MPVTHAKVSSIPDGTDTSLVRPTDWNADHVDSDVGTVFPSSPATNRRFYRTDRALQYYYNGTRWLSTTLYIQTLGEGDVFQGGGGATVDGTVARSVAGMAPTYDMWVIDFRTVSQVLTTNSGSHYWTLYAFYDGNLITNVTTAADPPTTRTSHIITIGGLLGANLTVSIYAAKTGSPGSLICAATVTYRLVG